MRRMVSADGYGICLFSANILQDFLRREKIRKRKLLSLLQKDKELYLTTQQEGIIEDGLWISAISQLEPFEQTEYHVKREKIYTIPPFGQEHYHSPQERWYKDEDGIISYTDIKYDVPAGKYLLSIKGYVRKESLEFPAPNCGFFFSLAEVDAFREFKNPRESDNCDFNVGSMK